MSSIGTVEILIFKIAAGLYVTAGKPVSIWLKRKKRNIQVTIQIQ